jgi:hypothetical protein
MSCCCRVAMLVATPQFSAMQQLWRLSSSRLQPSSSEQRRYKHCATCSCKTAHPWVWTMHLAAKQPDVDILQQTWTPRAHLESQPVLCMSARRWESNHLSCTVTLQDMLCGGGRLLDARRATTVAKAVGLSALQADSGTALGLLTVLGRLLARQQRLAAMLEHEPGTPSGDPVVIQPCP